MSNIRESDINTALSALTRHNHDAREQEARRTAALERIATALEQPPRADPLVFIVPTDVDQKSLHDIARTVRDAIRDGVNP